MADHFDRLGLPRRFAVDPAAAERAYIARSRAVHPDYHLAGSSADLSASLELSAALNEAYNTLLDPFTRAEYLLSLEGGPTAAEHKKMPAAFLAEMLELREQVEEARAGCPDDAAVLAADFGRRCDGLLAGIAEKFAEFEQLAADDPKRPRLLAEVRGLLNAAKFVRGLIRDLHAD
jgi:molecular chaperone HscB